MSNVFFLNKMVVPRIQISWKCKYFGNKIEGEK